MFTTLLPAIIVLVVLALIAALVLSIANKKFKVEVDPRINEIMEALPGANCGGCGFAGCAAYAQAVFEGKEVTCPVADESTNETVAKIMGKEFSANDKKLARVYCAGYNDNTVHDKEYTGIDNCGAAKALGGSSKACAYACFGLGTCVSVCPFDAIRIKNGLAMIDQSKCTGCGLCIDACPQDIIHLTPSKKTVTIPCSSLDKGAVSRKKCKVSCIACMKCVKECPVQAIRVENFHAIIDYDKCVNCKKCISVCPVNIIKEVI